MSLVNILLDPDGRYIYRVSTRGLERRPVGKSVKWRIVTDPKVKENFTKRLKVWKAFGKDIQLKEENDPSPETDE